MSSETSPTDGGEKSLGRRIVTRAGRGVSRPVQRLERALAGAGTVLGTVPALAVAFGGGRTTGSNGRPKPDRAHDGSPTGPGFRGRPRGAGSEAVGPPVATERVHRGLRADVRGAVPTDGGVTHWGTTAARGTNPTLWLSRTTGDAPESCQPLAGDGFAVARALARAHDGGVVIAGDRSPTADAATADGLAVAVDPSGQVRARHVVDRPAFASCSALCRCVDGGYLLAGGSMASDETHARPWVLKLDEELEPVWRTNGVRGEGDCPRLVRDRGDHIALIDGRDAPDAPLRFRTLERDGTPVAARPIDGTAGAHVRAATETAAGGLVLAGHRTDGAGSTRLWVAALDADGRRRWDRTYRRDGDAIGHDVVETADGLAVAGERTGAAGRRRATVVTVDDTGTWGREWTFDHGASARSVWVTMGGEAVESGTGRGSRGAGDRGGDGPTAEVLRVAGIALDRKPRRSIPWDGAVPI